MSTELLTKTERPPLQAHWDNAYADPWSRVAAQASRVPARLRPSADVAVSAVGSSSAIASFLG